MKTWTRPIIKVQKFVPNFCVVNCYFDFYEGEAWVEDNFHGGLNNNTDEFGFWDIHKVNWPAINPETGKTSIKVDSGDVITSWDAYKPIGTDLPPAGDGWKYKAYNGLGEIEKGAHNTNRVFYIITKDNPQILARSYNKNAS